MKNGNVVVNFPFGSLLCWRRWWVSSFHSGNFKSEHQHFLVRWECEAPRQGRKSSSSSSRIWEIMRSSLATISRREEEANFFQVFTVSCVETLSSWSCWSQITVSWFLQHLCMGIFHGVDFGWRATLKSIHKVESREIRDRRRLLDDKFSSQRSCSESIAHFY